MTNNELKAFLAYLSIPVIILLIIVGYSLYNSVCGHIADHMAEHRTVVRGESGQKFKTYQECCYAYDFNAAHVYLAKVQQVSENGFIKKYSNTNYRKIYTEGKAFVLRQEFAYLLSSGENGAKQRLLYLIKEEEADDEMIGDLVEIAIDCDDVPFAMTLLGKQSKYDYSLVLKATEHLAKGNNDSDLLYFIKTIPLSGNPPTVGHRNSISSDEYDYMASTDCINKSCDIALDYAINRGNRNLADSVLELYKSDVHWLKGGYDIKVKDQYYSKTPTGVMVKLGQYYIWSDNKSKKDAQTKYNQSVKKHMFY